jgi:hypothetical protein
MKKYPKSIITDRMNECLICGSYANIQVHHIFAGKNRSNSTKYGLVVPLCMYHHTGSNISVHGKNGHKLDMELKQLGQKAFEWKHTREEFIERFGKSYL